MQRIIRTWLVVLGSIWAMSALADPIAAQNSSKSTPSPAVERGRETYQASCAVCHGDRGNGKGPAAPALTPRPTDLTMLAKKNGGAFPRERVAAIIAGPDNMLISAHGPNEMPEWGPAFRALDPHGNSHALIAKVVSYLESIQAK